MHIRNLSKIYESVICHNDRLEIVNEDFTETVIEQLTNKFLDESKTFPREYIKKIVTRFGILRTNNVEGVKRVVNAYVRNKPEAFDPKNVDPELKDEFINNLEKLKNSPLDINRYNFKQLDEVVGSFNWDKEETVSDTRRIPPTEGYPAPVVFNKDGLVVMYAQDFTDSANIKKWLYQQDHREYSFCLCGGEGTYLTYRFGNIEDRGTSKSLYFVHDSTKPPGSINRVNVVQKSKNGTYYYTQAPNNGDKKYISWQNVLGYNSRLKIIQSPDDVFVYHPLTETEEALFAVRHTTPQLFHKLTKYKSKLAYISLQVGGFHNPLRLFNRLYKKDYADLSKDLQHTYVQVRALDAITPQENLLLLTTDLFEDSGDDDLISRLNQTQTELDNGVKNWLKPLTLDPTIMQYSTSNTREYYKQLIYRYIYALGGGSRR